MIHPHYELETCPFCDADAAIKEHKAVRAYPTYYTVRCTECSCVILRHFRTAEDAADYWNRRKKKHGEL